jgi:hypothetical protein
MKLIMDYLISEAFFKMFELLLNPPFMKIKTSSITVRFKIKQTENKLFR